MDPEFLDTDGEHIHDDSVSSVAWKFPGLELNLNKLNAFMSDLIQQLGADLYRYKGMLAVRGIRIDFDLIFFKVFCSNSISIDMRGRWRSAGDKFPFFSFFNLIIIIHIAYSTVKAFDFLFNH